MSMAGHGEVEYETAAGNDYPEHEATYESFLHLTVIGILNVITVVVALTLGGVLGHWGATAAFIVLAVIGVFQGLISGGTTFSAFITVVSILSLAFYGLG
jgi:hypothetical protein